MAACFFQLTVARKQSVRRFVLLRSDGQTANRLIHFSFCLLHRIYYRNHGYIGRNTAGAVQGEGRADVQHRRGQGACRLCVGVGRCPGYLAVLLSLSTDPRICALKFWPADATGWPREEGRGLPALPPIITGHLSLIRFYRHWCLSIWYLFGILTRFAFVFPSPTTTMQRRPWPTPSAPPWDPAGWTS